jgi:hypothetical protein
MFRLELREDEYRIVAPDGTEGEWSSYGERAEVHYGGADYLALLDCDEGDEEAAVESLLGGDDPRDDGRANGWVVKVEPQDCTTVDVEDEEVEEEETGDETDDNHPDDPDDDDDDEVTHV